MLHFAAREYIAEPGEGKADGGHNNMKLLKFLVVKFKEQSRIDIRDHDAKTALYRAAHQGVTDAVTLLMEHGADWTIERGKLSAPRAAAQLKSPATLEAMIRVVVQQNLQSAERLTAALNKLQKLSCPDDDHTENWATLFRCLWKPILEEMLLATGAAS